MNRTQFGKALLALTVTYNEDTEAESFAVKRDIYWRIFQCWPASRFQEAVDQHILSSKYFPTPSELIDLGRSRARAAAPPTIALPLPDETPEDKAARDEAMTAMRAFLESGPPTTRAKGRC